MFFDHLPDQNLICGHRGARSIAPENTLLSMVKAKEHGAHFWETDVRLSKDDELIIFHDDTLERTTDISTHMVFRDRADWHVDQYTLQELHELDAGSWFLATDPFGTVASGEVCGSEYAAIQKQKIPLLLEILYFCKSHSFPVNLELKSLRTPPGELHIVDMIVDTLHETNTTDLVLLSSFRFDYLQRARSISPDISLAVLAEGQHPLNLIHHLNSVSACAYHPDVAMCSNELILQLPKDGIRVNPWTVNDLQRAEELHALGAGVITDWPQRLTKTEKHAAYFREKTL